MFFFHRYHSSLNFRHSSLKIPQFPIPTRLAHFTQLFITQFFYFFMGPTLKHNVKPQLAYLRNILGLKGHFTLFFPFIPHNLPEPLINLLQKKNKKKPSTNPVKPPAQSSPSSSVAASSLSSSSTASSSSTWSPVAPMVSSNPPARWGKDEICGFLGSSSMASSTASSSSSSSSSSLSFLFFFLFFFLDLYP